MIKETRWLKTQTLVCFFLLAVKDESPKTLFWESTIYTSEPNKTINAKKGSALLWLANNNGD